MVTKVTLGSERVKSLMFYTKKKRWIITISWLFYTILYHTIWSTVNSPYHFNRPISLDKTLSFWLIFLKFLECYHFSTQRFNSDINNFKIVNFTFIHLILFIYFLKHLSDFVIFCFCFVYNLIFFKWNLFLNIITIKFVI